MIRLRFLVAAVASLTVVSAAACGGSSAKQATPEPTGVIDPDAGPPKPDGGEAGLPPDPLDTNYPAAHAPIPLVDDNGGTILKNMKIVTVTFDGDSKRAILEQFGDTITQTKWWDAVRDGYCDSMNRCVGVGSSGGHVHIADPPAASYTDSAFSTTSTIQDFIKAHVADGSFPSPDEDTLYAIYFPSSVSISLDNAGSCSDFGAYHNSVVVTAPAADEGGAPRQVDVAYAIMPRCGNSTTQLTVSGSHEFIEAATDPHVISPAYYMQNQLWSSIGGEVGDLCTSFNGNDTYVEGPFVVQRSWSNKAASMSHDPCVPAGAAPYFNVAPTTPVQVTNAIGIKVGSSKVIPLTAFSDAPMPADWALDAFETSHFMGGNDVLGFSFDRTEVHNGSKPNLTITLSARPSQGQATFVLTSKNGTVTHTWPLAVRAL
jgi:hypothetical protein